MFWSLLSGLQARGSPRPAFKPPCNDAVTVINYYLRPVHASEVMSAIPVNVAPTPIFPGKNVVPHRLPASCFTDAFR